MISISTCFEYELSIEEQFKLISEVGYDSVAIGGNYEHSKVLTDRSLLHTLMKDYNLKIDSIHGVCCDAEKAVELNTQCAIAAKDLGAKIVVIHPCKFFLTENELDSKVKTMIDVCEKLEPVAKDLDINIAIENIHPDYATDVLRKVLPQLNNKYFGFCYDSSHDQIDGPRDFLLLEKFKDRVVAVHLSDRIKEFVDHVVPGEGFINFDMITKILKSVKYSGSILMEMMTTHTKYKDPKQLLEKTYKSALEFRDRVY